jgi:phosphoserine aminotransferase
MPTDVLERAKEEMDNYKGTGQNIMEMSHRQEECSWISAMTKKEIKNFLRVPDNFVVMLQQGGATNQYTAIAKNLVGLKPYGKGMALSTGLWSSQALSELKKHCKMTVVADNIADNDCTTHVDPSRWNIDP